MIGRVVSTKMSKTAAVLVERRKKHKMYQKTFMRSKKYLVDDQLGVKEGDVVLIEKVRPISARKHWKIIKVVGADFVSLAEAELKQEAQAAIAEVLPEGKGLEVAEPKVLELVEAQAVEKPKAKKVKKGKE